MLKTCFLFCEKGDVACELDQQEKMHAITPNNL